MKQYLDGIPCLLILLGMLGPLPVAAAVMSTPHETDFNVLQGPYYSPGAAIEVISPNRLEHDPVLEEMIAQISVENIDRTALDLQNFRTRVYPSSGNRQAAAYLHDRLASIPGLEVGYQSDRYRNVIATLPGKESASGEVIVVGAHYDSSSSDPEDAPGATDNAGGVAIVLELARVMGGYQFDRTIQFAFWNAEETDREGSAEYVSHASETSQGIPIYVNYDSSSYDPDDRYILDVMFNEASKPFAELLSQYNTEYAINLDLTFNEHDCGSDHESFWEGGYPAITTHSRSHAPETHSPDDTVDLISSRYAKKNAQLGMLVLATTAGVDVQGFSLHF